MRLVSWNVNGIRAIVKKGLKDWIDTESPEILCLQETKAHQEQVPLEVTALSQYFQYYSRPIRKGYSGVAVFSKEEPLDVRYDFHEDFDDEGRLIELEFPQFVLLNVYFPNGKASPERLDYKMGFYREFQKHCADLRDQGKNLVICGDVNTAHREIDLARPKANEGISGFLPQERAWMNRFLADGFIDTFRYFNQEPDQYTWWSVRTQARERNVGWRIDYFFISEGLVEIMSGAGIMDEVMGSDHCPLYLDLVV
jgi:exodeoxyribonuclease-3